MAILWKQGLLIACWQESIRKLKEEREEAEIYRLHTDEDRDLSRFRANILSLNSPARHFVPGPQGL